VQIEIVLDFFKFILIAFVTYRAYSEEAVGIVIKFSAYFASGNIYHRTHPISKYYSTILYYNYTIEAFYVLMVTMT